MNKNIEGVCVLGHLGLGDHIILNAVYRHYANVFPLVCILVKYHNVPSVTFMLRDLQNVVIRPVEDDEEAVFFFTQVWKSDRAGLGVYGPGMNFKEWDQSFYRQAGISFQRRWDDWKCKRDEGMENQLDLPRWGSNWPIEDMIFVHDDRDRGFEINATSDPLMYQGHAAGSRIVRPNKTGLPLFIYQKWIERAVEIHAICSSFSLFIDSIELPKNPKLVLHDIRGEPLPVYRKNWEIVKPV